MSKTPETDLLTAGCGFGPFVEAIAEKCRELEVQRNQMFEVLVGIIGTDDPAGLKEARIGVSVAKHLWIRQNVSPAAILDAIQMLSTVKVQRVDTFWLTVQKYAYKYGHESVFLSQQGIPLKGEG